MEMISNHLMLDEDFGEFGIWYQEGSNMNQFYSDIAEDSFFHQYKQGSPVQNIKNTTKFNSQSTHLKHTSLLTLETDARVPEFETNTRSLSCSSDEMVNHISGQQHPQPKDWDVYFQIKNNPLVGIQSEDSVLSSSVVPDMVISENETFQDLTELLDQAYPLTKATSPRTTLSESHLQVLNIQPPSPKMEDSEPSCSFSVDLSSPASPPHAVEKRYKEMRRKNNIASKNASKLGMQCNREEMECLLHFWRSIGYLLGMEDAYNICAGSYEETYSIFQEIVEQVVFPTLSQPNEEFQLLVNNGIAALKIHSPLIERTSFINFSYDLVEYPKKPVLSWYGLFCHWMRIVFILLLPINWIRNYANNMGTSMLHVSSKKYRGVPCQKLSTSTSSKFLDYVPKLFFGR